MVETKLKRAKCSHLQRSSSWVRIAYMGFRMGRHRQITKHSTQQIMRSQSRKALEQRVNEDSERE